MTEKLKNELVEYTDQLLELNKYSWLFVIFSYGVFLMATGNFYLISPDYDTTFHSTRIIFLGSLLAMSLILKALPLSRLNRIPAHAMEMFLAFFLWQEAILSLIVYAHQSLNIILYYFVFLGACLGIGVISYPHMKKKASQLTGKKMMQNYFGMQTGNYSHIKVALSIILVVFVIPNYISRYSELTFQEAQMIFGIWTVLAMLIMVTELLVIKYRYFKKHLNDH